MIETLIFYLFAAILTGSAVAVISMRNPVHSVLFLILGFFNAAGLFVLMGAEFLAMLLVIVYVGAVAVLFLFVVMMLNVSVERFREGLTKYFGGAVAIAVILFIEMVVLFETSIPGQSSLQKAAPIDSSLTNTQALGNVIYTDYIFLFQTSGLILLVAMIGAIVLTFTPKQRMRKQVINDQVARDPKKTVRLVQVETGKGVS